MRLKLSPYQQPRSVSWCSSSDIASNNYRQMRWWSVVAAAVVVAQVVEGARILMMAVSGNNSHKIFFLSIAEALAERNHTVPFIHMTPNDFHSSYSEQSCNPFFSSITPNFLLDLGYPLTFYGRMINALVTVAESNTLSQYMYSRTEEECRKRHLWTEDIPSLAEISVNGSLFITNINEPMNDRIIPFVPTMVNVGGIHCHPAQPLPQDLEEWVAGAGDDGFIFFSLGSNVKESFMPEEHRNALLRVFASLEQRVLWKWDQDTMKDLPPNVRLAKWLPQQDILGDPRLRLFVTHGGRMSIQEAMYHGVPLLGLPVFMDQRYNLREVERIGLGRRLLWEDLTFDTLRQNIFDVMNNRSVKEKVLQRRELMRDQPMPIKQRLSYWVEYVIRHRGAPHLRCPAVIMPWYQLYNVDVWLVVVAVLVLVVAMVSLLTFKLLLALWSFLSSFRKRKQE
ncbi:UDP-glycosyltransferase UGT5-like isoform X2 [Panulirus ornatus]|uniref:UDP-glycosyltransferase UGT5-like isoform X2 n=1 Tax=Panulirus ornatus TaxID=150431 RepID=UPI003A8C13E4